MLRLASLGAVLCLRLPAPLLPGPNLAQRIEQADTIVVAKLNSAAIRVSGNQLSINITLHVDRVLKGDAIPGADLAAHLEGRSYFAAPNPGQSSVTEKLYGIWFLSSATRISTVISRDGSSGELYFAPVILPEGAPAGNLGATPAASVADELASAFRWTAETHGTQLHSLIEDSRSLESSITLPIYKQFAADKSATLRVVGIDGLIAANDPEGVKRAAADWSALSAAADVNPIINSLMAYSNSSDAEAVRALGALAMRDHPEPGLRENAAYALHAIHTKEALPALVALLDDTSDRVRPQALSGLCLFVRNASALTSDSVPSMSWMQIHPPTPFLNPETEHWCLLGGTTGPAGDLDAYASFWKSWWNEHQLEIQGR